MHNASETIRRACLGFLLAWLLIGSALPVTASIRRGPMRHWHAGIAARRAHTRGSGHHSRSRRAARRFYLPVTARIPSQSAASKLPAVPSPAAPAQGEQRIPRQESRKTAALQGIIRDTTSRGVVGAMIALTNRATAATRTISADSDGVFRLTDLAPGSYLLLVQSAGFENLTHDDVHLNAGDVVTIELTLAPTSTAAAAPASRLPRMVELGPFTPTVEAVMGPSSYRELRRRPDAEPGQELVAPEILPPAQQAFLEIPDRWNIAMPEWNRYGRNGEYPFVRKSHWWDPFNRNRLKSDEPIFGQQTFLNITATAETLADERRVPLTSNVSSPRPGSSDFFGKAEQFAPTQTFRFSFDLFHGDTSFRPVDWRIRVTPAVNVNYLNARELGIVNVDVRDGTPRRDSDPVLQEAFVQYKIRDLSPNYDFLSVRAGIQGFSSDFRGFLFVDEQPGER